MKNKNCWYCGSVEFTSNQIGDYEGFVYRIVNTTNGKFYVGRKSFWTYITKPPLKGYKRRRKIKKESKWNDYYSSSNELKMDIETLGKDNFKREILRLCKSKSECAYYEAKYQFDLDVLIEHSYNKLITARIIKNASLVESIKGNNGIKHEH